MILHVDGPVPSANLPVSDVFMNIDVDLCDMTCVQTLDITNTTAFSQKKTGDVAGSLPTTAFERKLDDRLDQVEQSFRSFKLTGLVDDDKQPYSPTPSLRRAHRDVVYDIEDLDQPGYVKVKSSSVKSNKSDKLEKKS